MNLILRMITWFEKAGVAPDPRRRLTITLFLLAPFPVILDAANTLVTGADLTRLLTVPIEIIIPMLGLYYIKRTDRHEFVAALAILLSAEFMLALMFFQEHSILAAALQYYIIIIIVTFLLCKRRAASIVSTILGVQVLVYLWQAKGHGLSLARDLDFEAYFFRVQMTNATVCLYVAFVSLSHVFFKQKADRNLRKEREWLLKNSRLNEVSDMTHNLISQISQPLRLLRSDLASLESTPGTVSTETEIETVNRLIYEVEEIIAVTRSFDWLHQSRNLTSHREASLPLLTKQIGVLVETKARESGWRLCLEDGVPAINLRGPLPSLVLLLVTICHTTFDRFGSDGEKFLFLSVHTHDDRDLCLKFSWRISGLIDPLDPGATSSLLASTNLIRDFLIRELIAECGVELREFRHEDSQVLTLTRPLQA